MSWYFNRTLLGDDYDLISKELLVTKDIKQLRNRSKNQRNNRGNNNIIRHYYSLYTDFLKWDKNVYSQMCEIITTHGRRWSCEWMISDKLAGYAAITLLFLWRYHTEVLLALLLFSIGETTTSSKNQSWNPLVSHNSSCWNCWSISID